MLLYACLVVGGLVALGFVFDRLGDQWRSAEAQATLLRQRTLDAKTLQLQGVFTQIHQNLRMIGLLPGIRAYGGKNQPKDTDAKYDPAFFTDDIRQTVQQVYNNLASNVAVSEVYGVLSGFRPELGEKPFFMLDELILAESKAGATGAAGPAAGSPADADEPPEVEDEEYRWFVGQLAAFQAQHPTFAFASIDAIPLAISPPMRTCDNTQFTSTRDGNPRDAAGLSLAVPFYGPDGAFRGMIVAIVRLNVLEALLADLPFVIVTDADRENARRLGLSTERPGEPLVLENPKLGLSVADRRQAGLLEAWAARPAQFLVHELKFPGAADWRLALQVPPVPPRGGLAELLFLVGMASVVVGGSFLGMVLLARRLRLVNADLQDISDQVGESAETLSEGSQSLAEKAMTASAALEEMARSMAEFREVNGATLALGEQMGKNAAETRTQAALGRREVDAAMEAVERVGGISESVDLALATLKDVAFQTNLLAINASVEAARAGEAGLGFAVVADAVRELAQKSDVASKGIEAQMAEARTFIGAAVHKVEDTQQVLTGITAAAERSHTAARALHDALERNTRSFDDLVGGLGQLEEVNHHNAAAAEELSNVAAEFAQRTDDLQDNVERIADMVN